MTNFDRFLSAPSLLPLQRSKTPPVACGDSPLKEGAQGYEKRPKPPSQREVARSAGGSAQKGAVCVLTVPT